MAGEWIKMECATPDKPEVLALAVRMGWDDPDMAVGKLFKMWRWFDQQTTDGNAAGVTPALLDRVVGVTGFIDAVAAVGWLTISDAGVALNKFDRHNGNTAKNRALTAKRVANFKGNAVANARTVTKALPREEKKREDRNTVGDAKRRTQLPDGFTPNETGIECARAKGISVDVELPKFTDFHKAKGSVMLDWQAAFRTWIGNARTFNRGADVAAVTVPAKPGIDPALAKIEADAKKAAPMPAEVRELASRLKTKTLTADTARAF